MNKKLLTIQVMKERISNMQKELNKLESSKQQQKTKSRSKSLTKSQDRSGSPFRNTSSNKRYKSPTFWTGNTLLAEENPYSSLKNMSPVKKITRKESFTFKSPVLQKIKKDVDFNFYQSVPTNTTQKQNYQTVGQSGTGCFGRQDQARVSDCFRHNPRIQKKKTYDFPKKDPILNPQPGKLSSKKVTKREFCSPKNIYTQNPNSNPNLYFHSTQPINLSPKLHNNRNNSPDLKLLLSNSAQSLVNVNQTPNSSKKHFGRYYVQNLGSKWNIHW